MRLLIDKQGAAVSHRPTLTERHRAPNGVPAKAKTLTGGEGTQSRATVVMMPVSMRCQLKAPCGLWSRICNGQTKLLWPREVVFSHLHAKRR